MSNTDDPYSILLGVIIGVLVATFVTAMFVCSRFEKNIMGGEVIIGHHTKYKCIKIEIRDVDGVWHKLPMEEKKDEKKIQER